MMNVIINVIERGRVFLVRIRVFLVRIRVFFVRIGVFLVRIRVFLVRNNRIFFSMKILIMFILEFFFLIIVL